MNQKSIYKKLILKLEQLDFECSSRRKLNLKRSVQQRYVSIQI